MSFESSDEPVEDVSQQLKSSLQRFIEKIAKSAAGDRQVTTGYIEALTSLIYQFATKCVARDLIAFRDHAGRKTLSEEDVVLMARKAPFYDHLKRHVREELGIGAKPGTPKRARKPAGNARLDDYRIRD